MKKPIVGRVLALIPAIILQLLLIVLLLTVLWPYAMPIMIIIDIAALILAIYIISKQDAAAYKEAWLVFILMLPIIGVVMYLLFGEKRTGLALRRKIDSAKTEMNYTFPETRDWKEYKAEDNEMRTIGTLVFGWKMTGMETYRCGDTRYYPLGENMLPDMLEDLKKAEKFIFIEYFIVEEGIFWNSIVDVLEERVKAGVDVRVMYDDLGSIGTYSRKSAQMLREKGIRCIPFNPVKYVTLRINNRDHRKMTIIDGKIAYSGGVNIADEYINEKVKFGHWKDIAFRVEGDPAISYTYMFTEFWNAFAGNDKVPMEYLPKECSDEGNNGHIFTYYDSPVHHEHVSNTIFIELLSQATKYVWFYTPYLMLDSSLNDAIIRAARRGVDVRIITPGVPDKKMVYRVSRSYYGPLLENGVRIFEYTPGFVHAKASICDDTIATMGTVNLDFRSLFLHFECNSVFCSSSIIGDVKKDYEETLKLCRERKLGDGLPGTKYGIVEALLRLIAPLL